MYALITGASSGIGRATAFALAKAGHSLVLAARRVERLKEIKIEIEKLYSALNVQYLVWDVREPHVLERWIQENPEIFQKITVLINNAGLAKGFGSIADGNPPDWDVMIDTNIKGLLYATRCFLKPWITRKSGHIVNIGSIAGRWTYPNGNVYSATKYAVRSLTESLRLDLLGTGIRVTEIAPGMVETEFSVVRFSGDEKRAGQVYQNMQPLTAEDIAEAIVWAVQRPAHVNIQEIVIYPTEQASPNHVFRHIP